MIRLNVEILQNLRQVSLIFELPPTVHCTIREEEVLLDDEENSTRSVIDLNGLRLETIKGAETNSTDSRHRTFKFPFVSLPNVVVPSPIDLQTISCLQRHSILSADRTFEVVQQSETNPDELNEVMFCHRFCDAHGHKHEHRYETPAPLDFHSNPTLVESIDQLIFSSNWLRKEFVRDDRVECPQCSSPLGSFDAKTQMVALNKCALLPYATDFLSSSFRRCEAGRYIVKVPKSSENVLLIWILPNEILHGSIGSSAGPVQYTRRRKALFTQVKSSDDALHNEWKRDFSVTTLLVNRLALDSLAARCVEQADSWNPSDRFHSFSLSAE